MIMNEQEQALRRAGLDVTKNQGAAQSAYANQIKTLVAEIHTLHETEQRYQESQRETQQLEQQRAQTVEEVRRRYQELDQTLMGTMARAERWKEEALAGLNETAQGYKEFSAQVEAVYQNMLREAREKDLQSSKHWEDGVKRGLKSVIEEAQDLGSQMELLVTKAFKGMEDALVTFVQTGKLDFKSLADSIIEDFIRIQIRSAIIGPLAQAFSGVMGGFGVSSGPGIDASGVGKMTLVKAHTGGVIGVDTLSKTSIKPSLFTNAPHFHRGGIVGNEVPIIAQKGEAVFTPGQMRLLGSALHSKPTVTVPTVTVSVKVENKVAGVEATASSRRDGQGNIDLNIMIQEVESKLARNISRGEGVAPVLERRYGLNPAVGSYR